MTTDLLVAGAGLGGLAAALAARRAGCEVRIIEQASTFSEVGAGIQLGPNVTAILEAWGLLAGSLAAQAVRPERLVVRDVCSGEPRATMRLGADFAARYGHPYLTIHRADLHRALHEAALAAGAQLQPGAQLQRVDAQADTVLVHLAEQGSPLAADALVGADGLWSSVRAHVVEGDAAPQFTGHLAYRSLAAQLDLPPGLRSQDVTAWLGPGLHVVTYPVRGGDALNVVCVVEGHPPGDARSWDNAGVLGGLQAALAGACTTLRDLAEAMPAWRLWALHARAPVAGPDAMARGRVALLGDAAHPMLPYLAQGAGMAIEDARELQRVLTQVRDGSMDVPTALRRYAFHRWERCARVQRRSARNGRIFHASGPLRAARDLSLRLLGERILDVPWLYAPQGAR